jgi:O-antigen/teichoic acid export membrane protein
MSVVRANFFANVAGRVWAALISLAFVPVYLWFLGIEAYGLIGLYATLFGFMALLDFGLGTTLNRELARYSTQSGAARPMRDLLRTLELAYWAVGAVTGMAITLLAPAIAPHWIKPDQLSGDTVETALALMGVAIACQWPLALYSGGLMGLQRQVTLNVISAAAVTVRGVGAVFVLWQVAATVEAFLAWQIVASLMETLATAIALWRALPRGAPGRFNLELALGSWRFAASVSAVSVFSVIVTQLDKVILSGLLPLAGFGYYMLATRLASGLYFLVGPVIATFFPRYSQLFASGDERELRRVYHQSCQLMSFLVLPPALILILFPYEILFLWTQNREIAENGCVVLSLLSAGTALNALASPPHILQLASGWTRLALIASAVAAALLVPLIYVMTIRYGAEGAAAVWVILNTANVAVNAILTHRRLLTGELRHWFRVDVGQPLFAAAVVAGIWKWVSVSPDAIGWGVANLAAVSVATLVATALAAPEVRRLTTGFFTSRFRRVT